MKSNQDTPSGRGGYREGSGRKAGSSNKMSAEMREAAKLTGRLPHEILLDIARGNPQSIQVPDANGKIVTKLVGVTLEDMKDAAKAASPYYAPKISTVEVISGVSEDDLDAIIARAAAEAGVSLGAGGEGEEGEAEGGESGSEASRTRRRTVNW